MKSQPLPQQSAIAIFRDASARLGFRLRRVVVTAFFPDSRTFFVEERPNAWTEGVGHVLPWERVASPQTLFRKFRNALRHAK